MNLGVGLKTLRELKGITLASLAENTNTTVSGLQLIEEGKVQPDKSLIKIICKALDLPPSYLLFYSLTGDDIDDDKKEAFALLTGPLKDFLEEEIREKHHIVDDEIKVSMARIIELLKTDPDYRIAWQANIAMSMLDALTPVMDKHGLTKSDLHQYVNKGASDFLDLLCIPTK